MPPFLGSCVAAADVGHVQSNALVQLSLGDSGGDYSDARAAIVARSSLGWRGHEAGSKSYVITGKP